MAQNERVATIEVLVDDCMLAVFRHLSIVDRIRIERVNKRWNELSKSSWSNVKKLDSNAHSWGFRPKFLTVGPREIKLSEFAEVLKRCGKFLEVIHETEIPDSQLAIASYCPNITTLVTSGDAAGVSALAKNCRNITELKLKEFLGTDTELSRLLKVNKNLRILKLVRTPEIKGKCLLSNLTLLETFKLNYGPDLNTRHLVNAVKKMKNLQVLKLRLESVMVNHVMMALQNHSNLEEIEFYFFYEVGDFPDEETKFGNLLENNQKLKVLIMDGFRFTVGDFLKKLNDNCIRELSVLSCSFINFYYFNKYLYKFKQLTRFEYEDHNDINYDNYNQLIKFITSLTNLKSLRIQLDDSLKDKNNFIPLSRLVSLEELHLESHLVTDECLKIFRLNLINLRKLSLSLSNFEDSTISDTGLYTITSLPHLEDLKVSFINSITMNGFNKMPNLKKFKCMDCDNIGDDALKKILSESEKLEYFSLFMCPVTIDLLLFANKITKKRNNNITLYIEKITFDFLDTEIKKIEKSPLLEFIETADE